MTNMESSTEEQSQAKQISGEM